MVKMSTNGAAYYLPVGEITYHYDTEIRHLAFGYGGRDRFPEKQVYKILPFVEYEVGNAKNANGK